MSTQDPRKDAARRPRAEPPARRPPASQSSPDVAAALARARQPLTWQPDSASAKYLGEHLPGRIDPAALLRLLRARADLLTITMPPPLAATAVTKIEMPRWARWQELPAPTPIRMPAWAHDEPPPVVHRITRPRWGREVRLPVVREIVQPKWDAAGNLIQGPMLAELGAWPLVEAGEGDEAEPSVPAQKPPQGRTNPPAKQRHEPAKQRHEPPKQRHEPPKQRHEPARQRHEPQKQRHEPQRHGREPAHQPPDTSRTPPQPEWLPDATAPAAPIPPPPVKRIRVVGPTVPAEVQAAPSPHAPPAVPQASEVLTAGVTTTTHVGLFGCLGRLVGIGVMAALAWLAVDVGLRLWVEQQAEIVSALIEAGGEPTPRLPALVSLGEADAPLQLVLGCDFADGRCRSALSWVVAWRDRQPRASRIVFLHRPGAAEGHLDVAAALHAAERQGLFWPIAMNLLEDPGTVTVGRVRALVEEHDGHLGRWERERTDSDVVLHVRTDRTMAEALELPEGVGLLASGVAVPVPDRTGEKELVAALERAAGDLDRALQVTGQDVAGAWRVLLAKEPERKRQRYEQWILRGERLGALPGAPHGP